MSEVVLTTRVTKKVNAKLEAHKKKVKALTGLTPSTSAIVRVALEKLLANGSRAA